MVVDSLTTRADYLIAEADALAAGDMDEVARIMAARNTDLSSFDKYLSAFDRKIVKLLPDDHPEHLMMAMRHVDASFGVFFCKVTR